MVDEDRIGERLRRLDDLLRYLERIRLRGWARYAEEREAQLACERALQLAIQICIDVGAHLVAELGIGAPDGYSGVFAGLCREGLLPSELSDRLGEAAKLRNLLVHLYDEIDDARVFATLDHLDDLRQFARIVRERAAAE